MRDGVHLITYADRLAGDLPALAALLRGPLAGLAGVHVLPFYLPFDGTDAGFDPVDHTVVDPRLGSWDDVAALAGTHEVMADLIVNHVSADSPWARDWLARGAESDSDGMILTFDRVFPDGAREADITRIYRPRSGLPFTPMLVAERRRLVWTTFTPTQLDLDVTHPAARRYLSEVLATLARAGVSVVRLDAIGYAVKTPGTDCFVTPQTLTFVDELTAEARGLGLQVLVEVHGNYALQQIIAPHVDYVYDFALPPLVLHALFRGDSAALRRWLAIRPANTVTVLDTHDGIGLVDASGEDGGDPLLPDAELDALAEWVHANTGGVSRRATRQVAFRARPHQIDTTYFEALGRDDERYLLARALQFFVPGVPQVYYVGLLAGSNDVGLLERTGEGREVNRRYYSPESIAAALARPVVRALLALARLRGTHPAFRGQAEVLDGARHELAIRWRAGGHEARLDTDLRAGRFTLAWTADDGSRATVASVGELAES